MTPIAAVTAAWAATLPEFTSAAVTVGVGIDLVDVEMFTALFDAGGQAFLDNGWTDAEQNDAEGSAERLAARWAAKEAVMKALRCGLGSVDPLDIEILTEEDGPPYVVLRRDALAAAAALGVARCHVSLCHEDGWAAALAVAERSPVLGGQTPRHEGDRYA